jgi:CSLREA domain-containing protein
MRRATVSLLCLVSILAMLAVAPAARATAVVTVDTFEDTFDGSCADPDCSLRDAIAAVDEGGTVRLPPGYYPLTLAGTGGVEAGDLDLDRAMTLIGTGEETGSFLDASGLGDRAFDVTAPITLRHLTLLGGSDVTTGGVVRTRTGSLRLVRVTILGGRAGDGGAVAVGAGGAATFDRSWVTGSQATDRGGALFVRGTATVRRSTLSGNGATAGGGLWVGRDAAVTIDTATVSGNTAVHGGGGIRTRGDVAIQSSTAARNLAAVGGAVMASPAAEVIAESSVFGGNDASVRGPTCSRRLISAGANVADSGRCGLTGPGDLAGVDPLLGALIQNGGPTPTHSLRLGSPALGRGTGCASTDQRGAPRRDCDSGAYELVLCLERPVTIVGTPGDDDLSGGIGRDVFLGLGGNDEFQGSLDADRACGRTGDDRLIGGPGNDRLAGNAGSDVLRGEDGKDLLLGGLGVDVCRGGAGRDTTHRCETVS